MKKLSLKKVALLIGLSFACLAVSYVISVSPRVKIVFSEAFATNLEHHADEMDLRSVTQLVAAMQAQGPLADPVWENRRQAAIERLEALLSDALTTAQVPSIEQVSTGE